MPESLGKTLRKIREAKDLSIAEVSDRTRISKKIIFAIEEDKLSEISSAFYTRGFVKSYAQFLGALEEKRVKDYLEGTQKKDKPVLILKGEKVPGDWFLKYKRHIGAGIVVVFGIWLLSFSFIQVTKFVKNVTVKYQEHAAKKKEAKMAEPITPKEKPSAPRKEVKAVELEIIARHNTWIQVIGDGELLFKGILKRGANETWHAEKDIKLKLGNAGNLTLKLNGKDLGLRGKKGEKKELVITKDGIK